MKTYKDVAAEIERLKAKAESLRKSEMAGVISRIKVAIDAYGLTAADLGLSASPAKRPASVAVSTNSGAGEAKYKDPASGKTWTGRGKPPLWIQGVEDRSAFLINGVFAAGNAPAKKRKAGKPGARTQAAAPQVGVPKYRDGATGKAWTGRGKPPDWIKNVEDRSAFLIDTSAAQAN
jgi:DNA-binding protein H-NS